MLTLYPCNETKDIETTIEIEVSIRRAIFFAGPKIFEIKDSELKKYINRISALTEFEKMVMTLFVTYTRHYSHSFWKLI